MAKSSPLPDERPAVAMAKAPVGAGDGREPSRRWAAMRALATACARGEAFSDSVRVGGVRTGWGSRGAGIGAGVSFISLRAAEM